MCAACGPLGQGWKRSEGFKAGKCHSVTTTLKYHEAGGWRTVKQPDEGRRASGWQSSKTAHLRMKEASTPPAGMRQLTARPPARQPPDDRGPHV